MKKQKARRTRHNYRTRVFRIENLEDRKMMTVTVDTAADVIANDGLTSLREAIVTTNSTPIDRIAFDSSLSGSTFHLNSQLFVTDTLTIDASALGQNIVVDAQRNSRVFDFSAAGGDFTLRGVTVTNGEIADVGGGIRFASNGDLTLVNSAVHDNRTTGNNNPGGGIYTQNGNITLVRSTLSENSTSGNDSDGGGIRTMLGDVTLTRSTVSANSTSGDDSDGGGVRTLGGTITVTNSTISGNRVSGTDSEGGGLHAVAGAVIVDQSTVTANSATSQIVGAGISMDPDNTSQNESLTLHNSIVAGNTFFSTPSDFLAPSGTGASLTVTNSLIGDNLGTGLAEAQTEDANGNLIGSSTKPIDPMLGPLSDNGGSTATHSLLRGSLALDAGDPLLLPNPNMADQRGVGFPRVVNGRVDIGAFEVDHVMVNDNSSDVDDGLPDNGLTTLREAVNIANASDNHTLVTFDPSLTGQTIGLVGVLEVTETLTVDATALESDVIVDAQGFSEIFRADPIFGATEPSLTIAGLTLTGGQTTGNGGAINFDSDGQLTITNSTITGNLAVGDGGGIYSWGDVDITSSTVSYNTSHSRGGGIYSQGDMDLSESTVSYNTSYGSGGGIAIQGDSPAITDSTISGNSAGQNGGGFYSDSTVGDITNSTISGNVAEMDGGGIHCNFFTYLNFSTVTENEAGGRGGGFYKSGPSVQMNSSIVSGNHANSLPNNLDGYFFGGGHNLLGDGDVPSGTNVTGVNDPLLGPLADNGGPTLTHAVLPGSPAIDAGNPAMMPGSAGVPEFDQRGELFTRVFGNGIDIGSFELQATPIDPDFNDDGNIDGVDIDLLQANIVGGPADPATFDLTGDGQVTIADRDEWLAQAGAANLPSGNPYLLGDATLDGVVDGQDFVLWNNNKFMSTSDWSGGDFNSDGIVDGQDFVLWNNHKFMSADNAAADQTDPWSFTDVTDEDEDSRSYERHVDDLFAALV